MAGRDVRRGVPEIWGAPAGHEVVRPNAAPVDQHAPLRQASLRRLLRARAAA